MRSLGPSRDTPRVRVEIRAAEIARMITETDFMGVREDRWDRGLQATNEGWGWYSNLRDADYRSPFNHQSEWDAGWLAREIWMTR